MRTLCPVNSVKYSTPNELKNMPSGPLRVIEVATPLLPALSDPPPAKVLPSFEEAVSTDTLAPDRCATYVSPLSGSTAMPAA